MERCTTNIAIFQNKQRTSCCKQGYISESMLQTWQYISKRQVVANTTNIYYFRTNNLANTRTLLYFRTSHVTHTTHNAIFQKGTWPHMLQTWLYISKRLVMANTISEQTTWLMLQTNLYCRMNTTAHATNMAINYV